MKEKGITLIALVISIIVLLILAGVSIATLTGENGIITKTIQAKEENQRASEIEHLETLRTECIMKKGANVGKNDYLNYLKNIEDDSIEEIDWYKKVVIEKSKNTYLISDDLKILYLGKNIEFIEIEINAENCYMAGIYDLNTNIKIPEIFKYENEYYVVTGVNFTWTTFRTTGIEFPDTITEISYCCMPNSYNLKKVLLGNGAKKICFSAFSSCYEIKNIEIPENITIIEDSAFESCIGLTEVILPNSLEKLGNRVFFNTISLKSISYGGIKYTIETKDKLNELLIEKGIATENIW